MNGRICIRPDVDMVGAAVVAVTNLKKEHKTSVRISVPSIERIVIKIWHHSHRPKSSLSRATKAKHLMNLHQNLL